MILRDFGLCARVTDRVRICASRSLDQRPKSVWAVFGYFVVFDWQLFFSHAVFAKDAYFQSYDFWSTQKTLIFDVEIISDFGTM